MHLLARALPPCLLVLLPVLTTAVIADDYDYIRGDEIYGDDYNYGLDYDRLRSVPKAPSGTLDGGGTSPESMRGRAGGLGQDAREGATSGTGSPSTVRRLEELRRATYPDPLEPGLDGNGASDGPAIPGQ